VGGYRPTNLAAHLVTNHLRLTAKGPAMMPNLPPRDELGTLLPLFPDTTPADDEPGTDRHTAVEVAPPVFDAEIVDEKPRPAGPAVLPAWARDRQTATAHAKWAARYAGRHAGHHAVRSPLYGLKAAWWVGRGVAISARHGARWLAASHHGKATMDAVRGADWDAMRTLTTERGRLVRRRLKIAGASTAATGIAITVGTLTLGTWVDWLLAAGLVVGAGALGRPEGAHVVADVPTPPTQVDLSMEMLTEALRASGLVKAGASPVLVAPILRDRNDRGWQTVFDLPRGGGKTASDVLGKRDVLAAELGVDEIQIVMTRVRASAGGNAARLRIWVADDDPYLGAPTLSPLIKAESWSVWDKIPFGADAMGNRIELDLLWQSMFFGGLPRRGKTFAQRIPSVAGVLDPHVRHYVADGKGGADWKPMQAVAHCLVIGADDEQLEQFKAMLSELIAEMSRRFAVLGTLPSSVCPEGKLTPEISRKHDMPLIFITIDELQEYLSAMEKDDRDWAINQLCRLARRAPAAGFILNAASQRPDAESVPTKLREIITYRYCTQVVDRTSSDMVLGKGKAAQGADASILSEEHKGVGVLVTGPGSFEISRCDYIDLPTFVEICARGRELRIKAGTLSGQATGVVASATAADIVIPPVLADVLLVMHGVDRMHTETILTRLANEDEDAYGDWTAETLASELERAEVNRTSKQVKIGDVNRAGYRRADLEAAIPAGATLPRVDPSPSTED
jgi:S-DNA-T family DNA segregation ATPase FtsK/SpoIIIE